MLKTIALFALAHAVVFGCHNQTALADELQLEAPAAGLERYAPSSNHLPPKDLNVSGQSSASNGELPDLAETRAAIANQTGSKIELNVSGWVSQQVEVTH